MKKLVLVYGGIAGFVIICINTLSFEMGVGHAWLGFLVMFIAFSSIFIAIKQYRDEALGGVIRFGTAFLLGFYLTVVASFVYVLVWEIYLAMTDYAFVDAYIASIIESRQASGASPADLAATVAETDAFRQNYASALFRLPMTFVEIFPVGILVSLVAALILRNRKVLAAG